MSSRSSIGVNVGTISLLVIFLLMCLSIFSVLSLSTAKSELSLAEKSAQAVSAYYAADLVLSEKVELVGRLLQQGAREWEVMEYAVSLAGSAESTGMTLRIEFSQEITPGQVLQAVLAVENRKLSVLSWQAVDNREWQPDYSINVWEGF